VVDLHTALRPLVEQPTTTPRPVEEIVAAARRRRLRRRSVGAAVMAAVLLVAVGTVASLGARSDVTTTEQPSTTAPPETTTSTTTPTTTTSTGSTAPSSTSSSLTTSTTTAPLPTGGSPSGPPGPISADDREPFGRIEAETYDAQQGVAVVAGPGDGYHLGSVGDGDHVMFRVDFDEALATRFEARVASGASAQGVIEVRLDDVASPPIATIVVTGTGGWSSFTTLADDTAAAIGGIHDLYVTFSSPTSATSSEGGDLAAVDWFRFQP
jgi:cytoskeletal protein RodZ